MADDTRSILQKVAGNDKTYLVAYFEGGDLRKVEGRVEEADQGFIRLETSGEVLIIGINQVSFLKGRRLP